MVLVGDDTDLLVFLCYHARQDGCDLFFRPEPKVHTRGMWGWLMKKVQGQLGKEVCRKSAFSSRRYWLRPHFTPVWRWKGNNVKEVRCLTLLCPTLLLQVKKDWFHCSVVSLQMDSMLWVIGDTLTNFQQSHTIYSHTVYSRLQQRPDITACACIYRAQRRHQRTGLESQRQSSAPYYDWFASCPTIPSSVDQM